MQYFRSKRWLNKSVWIITLALILRSFIAPGFMLDTSSGNKLAIVICNGPVSVNVHVDHSAHHHDDNQTGHTEKHLSPICGQWSTSSLLVFNAVFEPVLFDVPPVENSLYYKTPFFYQFPDNTNTIRSPPSLV